MTDASSNVRRDRVSERRIHSAAQSHQISARASAALARASAGQIEFAIPHDAAGWVIAGQSGAVAERAMLDLVLPSLHAANVATLTVRLPDKLGKAAAVVRDAASELRGELALGMPVAYLGVGRSAAAGWVASFDGKLDGTMSWNGTAGAALPYLRHVRTPSLLVADYGLHDIAWRLTAAKALSWRLGRSDVELVSGFAPLDDSMLARWFWERMLAPNAARRIAEQSHGRRRMLRVGAAAAILAPALGAVAIQPALAGAALPDFSHAASLKAHDIGGDAVLAAHAERRLERRAERAAERRLSAADIGGDNLSLLGALGGEVLTDGSGLKWFVNTDITFSTSSSASGAVSEASFTHAVAATTSAGGTTQDQLDNSYNGYESLCVVADNSVSAPCETGNANFDIYNKNGAPTEDAACSDRQIDFNEQTDGNLEISRDVYVPSNDSFARWLDVVTNTGTSPAEVTLETSNNLGSNMGTVITGDSAGNTAPTTTDTWVTTFQNYSGNTSTEPRLGHILGGSGAAVGLAGIFFENGNDTPYWGYTLNVPAGATQIIMDYAVGEPSKAAAAAKAAELAAGGDANQLNCMTSTQIGEVVNFAEAQPSTYSTPADSTLTEAAPGILANDGGGANLTAVLVARPAHAKRFKLNADGSFVYEPTPGFLGSDQFTYETENSDGAKSPVGVVTIDVTKPAVCRSRRDIVLHLRSDFHLPPTDRIASISATLDGKRLPATDTRDGDVNVDLRGDPRGKHVVHVVAKLSNGQVLKLSRTYRTCET
jgi:hypothetical protein